MFFNLFAAAETYISLTEPHGMQAESKGRGSLGQNPEMLTIKQQAKDLFNFAVLDNII